MEFKSFLNGQSFTSLGLGFLNANVGTSWGLLKVNWVCTCKAPRVECLLVWSNCSVNVNSFDLAYT